MNMHVVAFIVGLVALTNADVRDVLKNQQNVFSTGQPFAKQQHQNIATAAGNAKRFWWASENSPFTKSNFGSSPQHNTLHITPSHYQQQIQLPQQYHTKRHDYSQNPFMSGAYRQQQNIYAQMASLSGSPSEVNNLMADSTFAPRYQSATIPCYGALQVCAPKDACRNGFINENDLGLVQTQANNCDSQTETCCNIQANGQRYDQQPQPCIEANSACVSSKHCFNGYIDQSAEQKATIPSSSGFCEPSQVCCRYSLSKSANLVLDNEFAAAAQSTSEVLTKEGYVVNVPSNQYLPSRPETEYNPDSSNTDQSLIKPAPKCSNGAPDSSYPDCCANNGRGPYCCTNGANNPDCCANGGVGPNCCTNGVTNNPYCCANGAQNPQCTVIRDEVPTQPPVRPQPTPQQPRPTQRPQPQPQPTPARPNPQPQPQPRPTQQPQPRPTQQPQPRPTPQPQPRPNPQPQPRPTQRPYQPNPNVNVQDEAIFIPSACAAAMNCTPEEYCDATGRISKTPVDITNELVRVPMTDCMIKATGQRGKCCIDPDYTDPWPVGRTGQYVADELNAVFDDGSYKPDRQKGGNVKRQTQARNQVAANTNQVITRVAPPRRNIARRQSNNFVQQPSSEIKSFPAVIQAAQNSGFKNYPTCGLRNLNTQPRGRAPLGTGFGEFTWVAMVILESRKALLCGGAIISPRLVVTSANCVHGHRHNDVLIKGGEWRLGSDAEPKPFQIVRVQRIIFHPQYQAKTLQNDIALLYLENDIKYDETHIQPICLEETYSEPSTTDNCVTTGWGKEVLKVHLGNALMQHTSVSVLPQSDCQPRLAASNLSYAPSVLCGVTQYDACQVDNGSALACADKSGRYVLKGVYSTETNCENPNQIVAFTRADYEWIHSVLRNPAHAARS